MSQEIDYEKLKREMDEDGDFLIDEVITPDNVEPYEEVILSRTGDSGEMDYRIQVDTHAEDDDDYKLIDEFGSTLDEAQSAVNCYLNAGGTMERFKIWFAQS